MNVQAVWAIIIAFLLLLTGVSQAGSTAAIGVQAATAPVGAAAAASEDYWSRYPDVAADSYYGRRRPSGAREHYDQHGRFEGRTWNTQLDISILTSCGEHGSGGFNCLAFPNGARLGAIAWQSSVKAGNSEVLSFLILDDIQGSTTLMSAHHLGVSARSKTMTLPEAIEIAPGGRIWVYAEGWSDPHPGGFEAQIVLYFLGPILAVPQ